MREKDLTMVASDDVDAAGVVTYWTISGSTDPRCLQNGWIQEGLDPAELPEPADGSTAISLAVRQVTDRSHFARPLKRRGEFVIVAEEIEGDSWEGSQDCTVRLGPDGRPQVTPADHPLRAQIDRAFDDVTSAIDASTMQRWLAQYVRRFKCVTMRDTGGFYFVPDKDRWGKVVRALKRAGQYIYQIPAVFSNDLVDAVVDGLVREIESNVTTVNDELAKGDLGPRALRSRQAACKDTITKIEKYEKLFSVTLDGLRGNVQAAQANAAEAFLRAMAAATPAAA